MSQSHLYAYGVVRDEEDLDLELTVDGVEGADGVYTVSHGPLAAVVSDIDTMDPERSDENVRAHDDVLQTVLTEGDVTVVPMQFGMTFKHGRALKSVLRGGRRAFTKSLREIEGTAELGVKLVAGEDGDVDRAAIVEDVAERLREVGLEEAENGLFSDRLVFNRSYLVDRDEREAFDDAVTGIDEDYDDLTVQYTGPWAPYSFVDIEIGAKR